MLTVPLRVAVLCSQRAPGLLHLLEKDRRGGLWEIAGVISSEPEFAEQAAIRSRDVPFDVHPIHAFCTKRGHSVYRDPAARAEYDRATLELLQRYAPDILLLDGYLYLITAPLLDQFRGRVINIHFADLTDRASDGRPRFPGIRAVRDAVAAGRPETFATVHLVNELPDDGAPILRSWPFPVAPLAAYARRRLVTDMLRAYVFAHQEWMLNAAAGPMLGAALTLIARGDVDLNDLARSDPASVEPWTLTDRGTLLAPRGIARVRFAS